MSMSDWERLAEDALADARRLEDQNRALVTALEHIARDAPIVDPGHHDWNGNADDSYRQGQERKHWWLAQIARAALASVGGGK